MADGGQILRDQVPAGVKHLRPTGRLDGLQRLDLAIGLPLRNQAALACFLRDLQDPASPQFRQYLTSAQFAERFGPAPADYEAVKQFALAHGLSVKGAHSNRTLLDVSGTVADIEKAFHLSLRVYQHPTERRTFYAPDTEPSMDLAVPVLGISGLDDFVLPRPMNLNAATFHSYTDTNASAFLTGSGPSGYFMGNDFRAAYAPGVGLNGAGQSVGLFELDGYYAGDIAKYEALAKLPDVTLTNILLDSFSGAAGDNNIEVALDIDMAICMAPGLLQVMVYEGTNPDDILNRMATDNQAKQLSSSWGFGAQTDAVREQIYQQFAAQGQTMFQASGDSGAYSGAVASPSDDPNVTVVGGTTLVATGIYGAWSNETAWPGSGGGVSTTFPIPEWQQGVNMSACQGSTTMRNIPDVSGGAGILIWLIADNGDQGPIGGTSAATPLWAGFTALVNQQAAAQGRATVGFINPTLYAIGRSSGAALAFHDIVSGNNTNSSSPSNYFAAPGYDLCTGWGSPAGSNLINLLLSPPDALNISPVTNLVLTGPVGGPFVSSGQSFVLTNIGTNSIGWISGNGASWLNVSPGGGTVVPGRPAATVTPSASVAADNLPAGSYAAVLWFTNLTDGAVQSRGVTLNVAPPPVITSVPVILSQPASQSVFQGGAAVFTVEAAGNVPLSYQWRWNGTNLTDGGNTAGSASNVLTLQNVSPFNAGTYSVVVSNTLGSAVSSNALLTVAGLTGSGVTLSTLYAFTGNADGGNPNGLMQDTNGNFYGTTQGGGSNDSGVVFQMTPGGTLTTLDSFNYLNGGGYSPTAALVQGSDGLLYGTTEYGGTKDDGTLFKTTTNGALTTLVQFNGGNGAEPYRAIIQGADGNFYGTTVGGGSSDSGLVFCMTPGGTVTALASFSGPTGLNPNELIQAANGVLYGTTFNGGANGNGTVYQITTNGALTSLVSFNYTNGGYLPNAGLAQTPDGTLYGATYEGGAFGHGTIYAMSPSGAITTLYSFTGGADGSNPASTLTLGADGNFYGTAAYGGVDDDGTVFRIAPNGDLVTLLQFDGYDGANPMGALVFGADGNLYGAAENGGPADAGVIFRLSINAPTLQITTQPADQNAYVGANVVYSVSVAGNAPFACQWMRDGTNLTDGPAVTGSTTRVLTLLNVTTADSAIYSVTVSNSAGSVTSEEAALGVIVSPPQITVQPASQSQNVGGTATFTVTAVGDLPLSYQWLENGVALTDGGQITGSGASALTIQNLVETNNGIYSVIVSNSIAASASDQAVLTVYAVSIAGTTMASLHSFTGGADGGVPNGLAAGGNGLIYGTTQSGGASGHGAIFSVSTNGIFATVASFDGTNGSACMAGLTQAGNGLLYGTTEDGGTNFTGDIFSVTPLGVVSRVYSFPDSGDINPSSVLAQDAQGNFYGASQNPQTGDGAIFQMTPGGVVTNLHTFTGGDGTVAVDAPTLGTDGNFYGMTGGGAAHGYGGVFRMTTGGTLTNLYSFTGGADGYKPSGRLTQNIDGNFYGMTRRNVISGLSFYGTIFKVTPAGKLTTMYSFNYDDGEYPFSGLILASDGNFYGTTYYASTYAGAESANGTVFRMTPSGAFTTLSIFNGSDDGLQPESALVEGADGSLYGTTTGGGPGKHGTVFRLSFTSAPEILTQPVNQTNVAGATASFNVTVCGAPALSYQWTQNGVALTNGGSVSGANCRVLTLNNLGFANAGTYAVVVSNTLGQVTSAGAALVVVVPPIFQTVTQAGGTITFTWSASQGQNYQLQYNTNLATTNWINLGAAVTATNSLMEASDNTSPASQRYYRVVEFP
jgi:uncharacterized repeat protein (TIGR03803 family)